MQENSEKTENTQKASELKIDPKTPKPKKIGIFSEVFIFVFGFLLPFIALSVELTTRMCAGALFDPLPTIWHAVLIGFVPLSSILSIIAVKKDNRKYINQLLLLNGIALAVSIFYTIIFIPIIPIGVIAILFMGIGLLPLSPLLSMIASFKVNKHLLKINTTKSKSLIIGVILGITGIIVLELPVTMTRYGMELASSYDKETKLKGIKILRNFGNKDVMLRYCYVMSGHAPDLMSVFIESHSTMTPGKARDIYYQVTGKTFNTIAPPNALMSRLQTTDEFIFDNDQAADVVGGKVKNLSMASSRMDGIIDQDAGIAYTEWVMIFKNSANWQQEARTQIKLPAGGTVSRLTLWINGQEKEAAFAGKEQVKTAYKKVVQKRRDPVLVTSDGADRVLMQCFPVPPNNGEMKVRIGITYPLQFINKKQAVLPLPYLIERNFNLDDDFKHFVWIDSKKPVVTQSDKLTFQPNKNVYTLQTNINNEELEKKHSPIKLLTDIHDSWAEDIDKNYIITQKVSESTVKKPERLVLVIDGSYSMRNYASDITESLKSIDKSIETKILVASDNVVELSKPELIKSTVFEGGHDNTESLGRALQLGYEKDNTTIVWIHGPQPASEYGYESPENYSRYLSNTKNKGMFYEAQLGQGDNVLVKDLSKIKELKALPARENLTESLKSLFESWNGNSKELVFTRERIAVNQADKLDKNEKASSHLPRLWAYSQINQLIRKNNDKKAIEIAGNYHLVSGVSGAVVLESQQQYDEAGLKPVNSSSVPIIPEPEEWAMIIVALIVVIWFTYRRKKLCYVA